MILTVVNERWLRQEGFCSSMEVPASSLSPDVYSIRTAAAYISGESTSSLPRRRIVRMAGFWMRIRRDDRQSKGAIVPRTFSAQVQ
jgi:hypothetical protein